MRRAAVLLALFAGCVPSYDFAASPDGGGADAAAPESGTGTDAGRDASASGDAAPPPADAPPPPPPFDAAGIDAPVALNDLVLLMHMDEPSWSGADSVRDDSSYGNHGTPKGTAKTTPSGKFGGAGSFDGNGYVDIPDSVSLHATQGLTMAAWIYPTALQPPDAAVAYPGIFSKRADFGINVAYTLFLWTNDNVWGDLQGSGQSYRFNSNGAITTDNQWYHVAIVYDGSLVTSSQRASIYINGALDSAHDCDSMLAGQPTTPVDLLIGYLEQGTRDPDPNGYFVGRIDEVALWLRPLDASEIMALYQANGPL